MSFSSMCGSVLATMHYSSAEIDLLFYERKITVYYCAQNYVSIVLFSWFLLFLSVCMSVVRFGSVQYTHIGLVCMCVWHVVDVFVKFGDLYVTYSFFSFIHHSIETYTVHTRVYS